MRKRLPIDMRRTRSRTLEQEIRETEADERDERGSKAKRRVRVRIDVDETRGVDLAEWLGADSKRPRGRSEKQRPQYKHTEVRMRWMYP
eukprot:scaffold173275_cov39-Tisochrysis_lutea.AAC.1